MPDNRVQTGIDGLDDIFLGGIRRGNVIVVSGAPGSGKSLLGMEFIYRGITEFNEPGLMVVFEADPSMLTEDAAAFGWDLTGVQERGLLKIISTSPRVLEQEFRSPDSVLLQTAAEMGARRIFIDSIALLRGGTADGDDGHRSARSIPYRDVLQQLIEGLRREKLVALLAHEVGVHSESAATLEIAEMLADTVIRLQRGQSERGCYRTIEIFKSRGQDFDAGEHTLGIIGGKGLEVFRRVQSEIRDRAPQPSPNTKRSAVGTAALDQLTGGGLYEGSITLIIGVAGAGKSILGYQLCVEGARKSKKRALLVSADEHPAQILRNADVLDLGMREQVEKSDVRLLHASPLELEVDVHYKRICQTIEKHAIDRLVVDGLTAIRNALNNERRFREFMHGLMAFTKQRGMTTFLCYEHPEIFGMSQFMPDSGISSIVDNIVLLNLVELGNGLHRAMTIAKARGCDHAMTTREYTIGRGGISLLLPEEGAVPRPAFGEFFNLLSRAPTRFPRGRADAPPSDDQSGSEQS